jgi:hypothetical protein
MPPQSNNAAAKNAANKARKAEEEAKVAAQKLVNNAAKVAVAEEAAKKTAMNAKNMGVPGMSGGARRTKSHKQALRRLNKAMTKINNACKNKKRSTRRRKD